MVNKDSVKKDQYWKLQKINDYTIFGSVLEIQN